MPRGGPQNLGKKLSTNTSGVNALTFRRRERADGSVVYVSLPAGRERITLSLGPRGERVDQLREALRRRRAAGYPTCTLPTAQAALERFLAQRKPRCAYMSRARDGA